MKTVHLVDLEAIDTRYTAQWKTHLPTQLTKFGFNVNVISGSDSLDLPQTTTPGAFLNFAGTNFYKSEQQLKISLMFSKNEVKDGDYFLYTDAWNPTILQTKYMLDLLKIKAHIGVMWHAGSYDPQDFLGRIIGNNSWATTFEKSIFDAADHNFFATYFHADMFANTVLGHSSDKIIRTGWPMEYLNMDLFAYKFLPKEDIILFPHRIAPEKQLDIFKDLATYLPQYQFIACQESNLSKYEYHTLLGKAKMVFSASLQETLGISMYEGLYLDAIPFVPDRLSYREMYPGYLRHNDSWTDPRTYQSNKINLVKKIEYYMSHYEGIKETMFQDQLAQSIGTNFFSGNRMYQAIGNI